MQSQPHKAFCSPRCRRLLPPMLALPVACAMLFAACACGGNGSRSSAPSGGPITLSFYNTDLLYDVPFTDPVAQEITRKTGVTLDVYHGKSEVNAEPDIALLLTSRSSYDLLYVKSDVSRLVENGAVVALDDWIAPDGTHVNLIEEYGQNFKRLYGDELVKLRYRDGHIYTFGTYAVKSAIPEPSGTLQLQYAVLKELGWPRIRTLTDYADALRRYLAMHPTINGRPAVGLSLLTDSWHWYVGLSNPGNFVIGRPDDGQWIVNPDTLEASYKFLVPEMALYYRWLNGLYHEGLLDPESFTQSEEVWKSKIATGAVLGISYASWEFEDAEMPLVESGQEERTYARLSVVADADAYKDPALTDRGYSGGWGVCISRNCRDVLRAFQFMDWMCSEEAQVLTHWGIKGKNYEVQDGKRVVPQTELDFRKTRQDYSLRTGVGLWAYPFPDAGDGATGSDGDWLTPFARLRSSDTYLPVEKETLRAYGATHWSDLFPQPEELPRPRYGELWLYLLPPDVDKLVADADEYTKSMLIQCILAPEPQFDALWAEMTARLRDMGMEDAGRTMSALIQEKMQLWGMP